MDRFEILSLLGTTVLIAGILTVEHYLWGGDDPDRPKFKPQVNYAIGLGTVVGGLMAWVVLVGYLPWYVGLAICSAAAASGIPDFFVLRHEQKIQEQRRQQEWENLLSRNTKLAARIALLEKVEGHRSGSRLRDLAETLSFSLGAAQREMEMLQLFQEQAEPLLRPIIDAANGEAEEGE